MWKLFFEICDFFCGFIPGRKKREYVRSKYLFDWRKKYNALRTTFPELKFRRTRIIKGGWNIGFVVDKKYVFKIRKFSDKNASTEKIVREKRITDALRAASPLRIPDIEIIKIQNYTFYRYTFIPGKSLNSFSKRTISRYSWFWGIQLAYFIYAVHNARPPEIDDLRRGDGDGWNHNDICNNVIVDKKTMQIIGIIDWEYAGWGPLEKEFRNSVIFSRKIIDSNMPVAIVVEYYAQVKKHQRDAQNAPKNE